MLTIDVMEKQSLWQINIVTIKMMTVTIIMRLVMVVTVIDAMANNYKKAISSCYSLLSGLDFEVICSIFV